MKCKPNPLRASLLTSILRIRRKVKVIQTRGDGGDEGVRVEAEVIDQEVLYLFCLVAELDTLCEHKACP